MKEFFISLAILAAGLTEATAATEKDTVSISMNKVEKIVKDETINTKGKPATKYYAIVDGMLVSTSKSVADKVEICRRFKAKCALAAVRNKKTKAILRIILD